MIRIKSKVSWTIKYWKNNGLVTLQTKLNANDQETKQETEAEMCTKNTTDTISDSGNTLVVVKRGILRKSNKYSFNLTWMTIAGGIAHFTVNRDWPKGGTPKEGAK